MNQNPSSSRITRPRTVAVLVGLLVLIGGSVIGYSTIFGNSTTSISYNEAFKQFAEDQGANSEEAIDGLPVPGVYRYSTTGKETTKFLTTASHDYPAESAITVTKSGCGVRMEWAPIRERSEYLEMCRLDGRLVLKNYGGAHEFFGMRNEHFLTCPEKTWFIPVAENGDGTDVACEGEGLVHNRTTASVTDTEIVIGGQKVNGFSIETRFVSKGSFNGTTLRTITVDEDGVLLSWTDDVEGFTPTPAGNADYSENFSLTLMPK